MEKIVLFTFVFLAAVVMINASNDTNTTVPTSVPKDATSLASNETTTPAPTTPAAKETTTAAAAAIQPLAVFVLACAFLGLMH